jgi:predicted nucleotidyltransferase
MKTREEILASLGAAKTELQERFRVRTLALFGSYARNQQTEKSDVDILVEVDPSIGLGFVSLADELERRLQQKVDLVSSRAVKPNRRRLIEPDLIYV